MKRYTVEPRFTNLICSWRPFVTRNVRKPKLCVLSESYTATDAVPPILPACRQPLLPACVFVTRDFFFRKICSWTNLFVMRGVREPRFHCNWLRTQTHTNHFITHLNINWSLQLCKTNQNEKNKNYLRIFVTFLTFALSEIRWPVQAKRCDLLMAACAQWVLGLFKDTLSTAEVTFPGM
jgi:hypothetical protein